MQYRTRHLIVSGVVSIIMLVATGISTAQATLPQAQEKYDAGDYKAALKLISQAMSGSRLPPDQRYALLMLKGESMLRLGDRVAAADTFTQAANAKAGERETAVARATSLLVKKSPKNLYQPAGGSAQPLDILDPESRKKAFAALFADTQASLKPRVEQALRATTLPPTMEVLQALIDQGAMEYLSAGSAPQTKEELMSLGEHARELMSSEIKRLSARIGQLQDLGTSITGTDAGFGRRGLQIPEQREVQEMVDYLRKIETTAQRARARAREMGMDGSAWEPIISDASEAADYGESVLGLGP